MRESRWPLLQLFRCRSAPGVRKTHVQIDEGINPQHERDCTNQLTFNELYERYYNEYALIETKTATKTKAVVDRHIIPAWVIINEYHHTQK